MTVFLNLFLIFKKNGHIKKKFFHNACVAAINGVTHAFINHPMGCGSSFKQISVFLGKLDFSVGLHNMCNHCPKEAYKVMC